MDGDMMRYIPGLAKIFYQGQLDSIKTKKTCSSSTYTNKNILEFNINLTKNHTPIFQACCYVFLSRSEKILMLRKQLMVT